MMPHIYYSLTQISGTTSRVFILGVWNHFCGAITILLGLMFSQAPHQEKELLAIILCLHWLMRYISSSGCFELFGIYVVGNFGVIFSLAHTGSSEKMKKCGFVTFSVI